MGARKKTSATHRPVVWVVGASRGIGREIAKQFASIGCEVCVSSRSSKELGTLVKEIGTLGGRAYAYPLDIRNRRSISRAITAIEKQFQAVDVLINNAGVTVFKSFHATTISEFDSIIETNLLGPIQCTKGILSSMLKRKRGWIITILSRAAVMTFTHSSAYTATKAGMLGMMNVLREEVRASNIRVVNILPGPTETKMWSAASRKKYAAQMMKPKSVAETVLALYLSPDDVMIEEVVLLPVAGDIK